MARTNGSRLNLLGVVSVLIGIAAFVATQKPLAGCGPRQIAAAGIGVGVLAFVVSLMLRWGSGVPVLGILISLAALVVVANSDGTLQAWWAKIHPSQTPAPAAVAPSQQPAVAPADTGDHYKPKSIFDDDRSSPANNTGGSHAVPPTTPLTHTPAPSVVTPLPAPAIVQPAGPTLGEARAKLDAATAAVERSLANDPAYMAAKAEVAAADVKRKAALAESGSGSPQVQEASTQWLDAKTKQKKLLDAAAAKDPAVQTATKLMGDAVRGK